MQKTPFLFLYIIPSVTFWALAFPAISIALEELSPYNITLFRLGIGSLLFVTLLSLHNPSKFNIQRKHLVEVFLLGVLGVTAYHLGLNYGEVFVSPATASLIVAASPLFIALFSITIKKKIPTRYTTSGILLSFFGVIVISLYGTPNAQIQIEYLAGAGAVLISALSAAFYMLLSKKLLKEYEPLQLTTHAFIFSAGILLPFNTAESLHQFTTLSTSTLGAITFLAIFPTVISYLLWSKALHLTNATRLAPSLYLIPLLSTGFSYLFFELWFKQMSESTLQS